MEKSLPRVVPSLPKFTRWGSGKITMIFSGAFLIGQYIGHTGAEYLEHSYDCDCSAHHIDDE
ncbi:Essential MCU regulator, mitochondrial [Caenorhabditis elegans]|uniref:Essential MCU regulator, mitochondrial n=1 Tax=Caenorhabditis elegans TaxID=6239 RepID=C9IY32_CAEEL|nr:Essential MCU regulator, mitochondrial [Caenorhabditis elegans]CBG22737.1 Essential MCU regulator, mitochondrial [Caenorhabditis elegans]|eukprot:NP_001256390.1 Uncharacterized protein CELE_C52E4.12 [Caenorhabditis elegans]